MELSEDCHQERGHFFFKSRFYSELQTLNEDQVFKSWVLKSTVARLMGRNLYVTKIKRCNKIFYKMFLSLPAYIANAIQEIHQTALNVDHNSGPDFTAYGNLRLLVSLRKQRT